MSTKSFIISLPIITGDQDRRRLRKSFSFGCNLQNAVMGGGWDRVLIHPENRGIYTQSDSSKKSSRNIWSLAVVSVDQRY